MSGTTTLTDKWPVIGRHEQAAVWLTVRTDLGRAPRTIDAYGRGLAEYLLMCEREDVDPATANRFHIALYVRGLSSRRHRRGASVISIDSGAGLANATIQQRLVPVRLFENEQRHGWHVVMVGEVRRRQCTRRRPETS